MAEYKEIAIDEIEVLENIRTQTSGINLTELMESIKQEGLKTPIFVTDKAKLGGGKGYVLVFGFRRLTACKKLGWKKIQAMYDPGLTRPDIFVLNSLENIQREDITPIELGRMVETLTKTGMTTTEVAVRVGKPHGQIKTALELYQELPEKYREKVAYGGTRRKKATIPAEVAKRVLETRLGQKEKEQLLHEVLERELSLKEVNLAVKFVSAGLGVKEAVKSLKEISVVSVDIPFETEKLEQIKDKYDDMTVTKVIKNIIYGRLPPLKTTNKSILD